MPTISQKRDFFMGKEYVKKVTVTNGGEFHAYLPPEVAEELDYTYEKAATLQDAENKRDATLKEFEALRKAKKRVIAVEFKMTENTLVSIADVANKYAVPGGFHKMSIAFSSGHGYCLTVCEYTEEESRPVGGGVYYKYKRAEAQPYPRGAVSDVITGYKHEKRPTDVHDWSQELEDMLCDMLQKTIDLSSQLLKFTHPQNIVQASLEYSAAKLLAAPDERRTPSE